MTKLFAHVVVAVALALAFPASAPADKGSGGQQPGEVKVEGTITMVDITANTVTIKTRRGTVQVTVTINTKIERNDSRATLADFRLGDRGQAVYVPGGVASKLEATGP